MKFQATTLFIILLMSFKGMGQSSTYSEWRQYNVSGKLNLVAESFAPNNAASSPEMQISVDNGELVIDYIVDMSNDKKRSPVGVKISEWNLLVDLDISLDSVPVPFRIDHVVGAIGYVTQNEKSSSHRIKIADLLERFGNMSGTLDIKLNIRYSSINCDTPPRISGLEWAGFSVGAAAGLTLVGLSISANSEAKEIYAQYEMQYLPLDGRRLYSEYEDKRDQANLLLFSGLSVLAVDAGILIWRLIDQRDNMNLYETLCSSNTQTIGDFQISPYYDSNLNSLPGPSLGMSLSYRF